jgi:prophage DNA circulation protein
MIWQDQDEVAAIIQRIGPVVMSTVEARSGADTSNLRRLVGKLLASDAAVTDSASFATEFKACLDEARNAGATWQSMGRVRLAALAETPQSLSATVLVQAIVRLSLAQEARLITLLTFTSRDDVENVARTIGAAFDQAAEVAADDLQAGIYMAIIGLQADVTKYLTDQGRQLPRVIQYHFAQVMPALAMSQRVYSTGSRSDELRLENKVVHPAFMPMDGRMLAV